MTTNSQRFNLALRAHAAEHAAMHEKGLSAIGRVGTVGRPAGGLGIPWYMRGGGRATPASPARRVNPARPYSGGSSTYATARTASYSAPKRARYDYSRQTVAGLGEGAGPGNGIFIVLGLGVAAGLIYIAYDELAGTGRKLRRARR